MNPADLGTQKVGIERRKDLGRLIGIFNGEDETSKRTGVLSDEMTAFQAAASLLQGCSPSPSFLSGGSASPSATTPSAPTTIAEFKFGTC